MPTVKDKTTGKVISRQLYNEEGAQTAASIAKSNPNWEVSYDTNDARSRSQVNQAGSGTTGFSDIGGMKEYSKGGRVDEYKKGGKTERKVVLWGEKERSMQRAKNKYKKKMKEIKAQDPAKNKAKKGLIIDSRPAYEPRRIKYPFDSTLYVREDRPETKKEKRQLKRKTRRGFRKTKRDIRKKDRQRIRKARQKNES